jgi:hypothetical protein
MRALPTGAGCDGGEADLLLGSGLREEYDLKGGEEAVCARSF